MELSTGTSKVGRPSASNFDDDASTACACSAVECSKLAPSNIPGVWSCINVLLFLWSLLLVVEILHNDDDNDEDDGANHFLEDTRLYLVWSFFTTIIWCLEVILTVVARADDENWQISWPIKMELLLAVYFTFDSILEFRNWQSADGASVDAEILDAAIGTIAYLYLVVKARPWDHFCKMQQRDTYDRFV